VSNLPDSTEVLIIGGGIVGCSIAYHLTKLGIKDVVLLEQNQLTAGTTWHAAGLVGQLRATANLTHLARYTTELFAGLEQETGRATGYRKTGSLSVALNTERLEELNRQASTARAFGIEVEQISGADVASHWSDINIEDICGAVYLPGDGQTNPVDTTQALAAGARKGGALILENQHVEKISADAEKVLSVTTADGVIKTKKLVIAAGMWSRQLGASIGISIPLQAAEHFYIVTEPIESLRSGMPTLRVPDEFAYFKEDAGKLLLGAFEPVAKPWSVNGVSKDFAFGTLPEDIDHFEPILALAARRFPKLNTAGIQFFLTGLKASRLMTGTCWVRHRNTITFLSPRALTLLAFNLPEARGKYWPNGSQRITLRWIYGMWISGARFHFSQTENTSSTGPGKPWGFCMPCTGRTANMKPREVPEEVLSMTA